MQKAVYNRDVYKAETMCHSHCSIRHVSCCLAVRRIEELFISNTSRNAIMSHSEASLMESINDDVTDTIL